MEWERRGWKNEKRMVWVITIFLCLLKKNTQQKERGGGGYFDYFLCRPNFSPTFKNRELGFVWIQLIFAETENWKHCSKIIFKCMNSTVGPIFNFFFWIKWLWVSWIVREQCCYSAWTVIIVDQILTIFFVDQIFPPPSKTES